MTILEDGAGTGNKTKVNANNRIYTQSITESEQEHSTDNGESFNINTGNVALTGTGDSAVLYFKNDETEDFVVKSFAVGIGNRSATVDDQAVITIIRNPTGGDLITDATAVDMNQNRNFGSSNTLSTTTLAFKGKDGGTITGGNDFAQFFQGDGRLIADIDIVLPKGSSVAIKVDLNTSGGANVYGALIGHIRDKNE